MMMMTMGIVDGNHHDIGDYERMMHDPISNGARERTGERYKTKRRKHRSFS